MDGPARKHLLTEKLYERLKQYKNYDDAGGYLATGFAFERYHIFKLSLDRIDNSKEHFPNDGLQNLRFVVAGMNHFTNPCSIKNTCEWFCKKQCEQPSKEVYEKTWTRLIQKKSLFQSTIGNIFRRDTKKSAEFCKQFPRLSDFRTYVFQLLESQKLRCAVSGIFMSDSHYVPRYERRLQPSIDAIDPRLYHTKGNLRIVISCLNSFNHIKRKRDSSPDPPHYWTKELFESYIGKRRKLNHNNA